MKILIVDDHIMFREGLAALLSMQEDVEVVGGAGSIKDAINLARECKPDIILMDFSLPDGNGPDATRIILAEQPDIQVIFLTVHGGSQTLFEALRSGAKGYLLKNLPAGKLVAALRGVLNNEAPLSREMTHRVIEEFSKLRPPNTMDQVKLGNLTMREVDILRELASFSSNEEIGQRLSLSETTVKNHVHGILKKLKVKNRREAGWFAVEQGLGK
jgi:DNA-binding NarL/FixJ family response regulator